MEELNLLVQLVAAAGSVIAAFAAWQALKLARQANDLAESTAKESAKHVEESNRVAQEAAHKAEAHARDVEKRESARDQRSIASNMQAWWAKDEKQSRWGIMVSTTGPVNSVFFDVTVSVSIKGSAEEFHVATLPPGLYFIHSVRDNYGNWGELELVTDASSFNPLLHATSHKVENITFQDQIGERWTWARGTGLELN